MQIPDKFQQAHPLQLPDNYNFDGNRLKQVGYEWADEYKPHIHAVFLFLQQNNFLCNAHQLNNISKDDCLVLTEEIKQNDRNIQCYILKNQDGEAQISKNNGVTRLNLILEIISNIGTVFINIKCWFQEESHNIMLIRHQFNALLKR